MTAAINLTEVFVTEEELNRAVIVEDAARKFLEMKKLADDYAAMLSTARDELIAVYSDYSANQECENPDCDFGCDLCPAERYATTGEFGDLRVTVTPTTKKVYDSKALLALAVKADPKREKLFKLDDTKAKKLVGADELFTTTDGGYRVEVKARAV